MRLSRRLSCLVFATLFLAGAASAQVRISQIYGGGGNSGATYKNDFIEIFNAGTSSVSVNGWSVQYASSSGTTWSTTALPNVTLSPGQYLLVQEAVGAGGTTNLPTPDATGSIAMSATAGKVALRSSTTAFASGTTCPTGADVIDFVPFGTGGCTPGTPAPSNTNAVLRKTAGCTSTSNNANDFAAGAPTPRNTATTLNPCSGGSTNPTVAVALSPSAVQVGENFTVRATVVFGTNPASTGIAVVANLAPVGGSATQALYDDGAHDDGAAGDKVYGYVATVAAGTTTGSKSIGVGVADNEARSGSGSASLTVLQLMAIHDVQGNGNDSPYLGQVVAVEGIVTARKNNGFFLQATEANYDADPMTSEAIFVFTSSPPDANATVGNKVRAQGTVQEFVSSSNPHMLKMTELGNFATYSSLSSGNPLPAAIAPSASLMQPTSAIDALERYEFMRVSVPSLKVVAPVGANINEATAASPPDGTFFGVLPGVARPYREEGLNALDVTPFPVGVNPPVFDTNPERLRVQSTGQPGATAIAVDVGDTVNGLVGVLDYAFGAYSLMPDPGASITVTPGATASAASVPKNNEITIGGFNLLRFYDDADFPGSGTPGSGDTVLQTATVAKRVKKTANAICAYVRTPDILGVVEVENLAVLQQLADAINSGNTQDPGSCATNPQYVAYLEEGNDIGGIDVGFLVSTRAVAAGVARVEVLEVAQIGKNSTLSNPNGSTDPLNDRPSLMLRARVHQANGASSDLTVIANHLRSLSSHNSLAAGSDGWPTEGARVRAKRAAQAKEVADFVHARQQANPNERIVMLGDFNAFEFSDGYVDSMGIITGREAGPSEVLNYVDSPITVPLTTLVEPQGYSFSFDGNAQSLDHMVVNQALLDANVVRAEHARINADFGEDNFGDFTVPVRVSDHDPVVLYLTENSFATSDLAAGVVPTSPNVTIGSPATWGVGVANAGPDDASLVKLQLVLDLASNGMAVTPPAGWTCGARIVAATTTTVKCTGATLASGDSASFVVSVPTNRDLGGRALKLSATVSSAMTDPSLGNNSAEGSVNVQAWADLATTVKPPTVSGQMTRPGMFVVGASNGGPHEARNAVLVIAVNGPRSIVMGITGSLTCRNATNTPTMSTWNCPANTWYANGRKDSVSVTVNPAYANGGSISVGAGFSSETGDPNPGNNAASAAVLVP